MSGGERRYLVRSPKICVEIPMGNFWWCLKVAKSIRGTQGISQVQEGRYANSYVWSWNRDRYPSSEIRLGAAIDLPARWNTFTCQGTSAPLAVQACGAN